MVSQLRKGSVSI